MYHYFFTQRRRNDIKTVGEWLERVLLHALADQPEKSLSHESYTAAQNNAPWTNQHDHVTDCHCHKKGRSFNYLPRQGIALGGRLSNLNGSDPTWITKH